MIRMQLTNFQLEKLSSYFLTFSQLTAGSLLLKFFEPGAKIEFNIKSLIILIVALLVTSFSFIIGLIVAGKVRQKMEV